MGEGKMCPLPLRGRDRERGATSHKETGEDGVEMA
jgi:hypothetical protein